MSEPGLQEKIAAIRERIAAAAKRAGRRADEITLIAVSKTHPADVIRAAFELGIHHFGENRVQEWEGKRARVESLSAQWHLIGHLQSNKAAKAARIFHSVDSVDDLALVQRLDRARADMHPAVLGRCGKSSSFFWRLAYVKGRFATEAWKKAASLIDGDVSRFR